MSDALLRQIAMLRAIPRYPNKVYVSVLRSALKSAGFETSARTIQRDLNTLSAVIPLISDSEIPQGWSWHKDASQLELPALEPEAALTFQLVQRFMQPLLPSTTLRYLQPWFATSQALLSKFDGEIAPWSSKVRVLPRGMQLHAPTVDTEVQSTIYYCLREEFRAEITYASRGSSELKTYMVSPLAIVVRGSIIYVLCTMKDYSDIRQLALHRIRSASPTSQKVNRPENFDLDTYIASGAFGILDSEQILNLVVDFEANAASNLFETPISHDQELKSMNNDKIRLTASVKDNLELIWWLLAFGDQVEVISPAKLRKKIIKMIQGMSLKYE